jgi:hypothetical protein
LTIALPRQAGAEEALVIRLSVGVLPRRARVVVETLDGEIAGSVTPYGIRPGRKAGIYTIPIPDKAVSNKKITLRLKVLEQGAKSSRPPARAEIEAAKVAFTRVSREQDRAEKPKK